MANKDPYEILGVSRTAAPAEIKQAYRRLAKQYHPDRNPGNKAAEQRFKEVHAAYEVVGDPQRRAQYDRFGAGGPAPDVHAWTTGASPFESIHFDFGGGDLTSIFEQFFSRAASPATRRRTARRPAVRGADLEHTLELSFDDAVRGAEREIVLTTSGPSQGQERIHFRVPAGVEDGQRLRLRGQGQEGPGGRGDLLILCRVQPHPCFRREGLDLLLDLKLTFTEAALGTEAEIPTLRGQTVVKVPPGTSGGTRLRLRGRGIQDARTGRTGDLYAVVRIEVPKRLSARARELIQQLDHELNQGPCPDPGA